MVPLNGDAADEWLHVFAEALASVANAARADTKEADAADDDITADLLTRITSEADKQLWLVEAHLEAAP